MNITKVVFYYRRIIIISHLNRGIEFVCAKILGKSFIAQNQRIIVKELSEIVFQRTTKKSNEKNVESNSVGLYMGYEHFWTRTFEITNYMSN